MILYGFTEAYAPRPGSGRTPDTHPMDSRRFLSGTFLAGVERASSVHDSLT